MRKSVNLICDYAHSFFEEDFYPMRYTGIIVILKSKVYLIINVSVAVDFIEAGEDGYF